MGAFSLIVVINLLNRCAMTVSNESDSDGNDFADEWLRQPDTLFVESSFDSQLNSPKKNKGGKKIDSGSEGFGDFNISDQLVQNLKSGMGLDKLFDLQKLMLEKVKESCDANGFFGFQHGSICESDLCVCSSTGSGKTIAYLLPVIHAMQSVKGSLPGLPKVLVLAPTKDLVDQIASVCVQLVSSTGFVVFKIGSSSCTLAEEAQSLVSECPFTNEFRPIGADIVIATPGRLAEHLRNTKGFSLKYLRFLVIDEVDALFNTHPFDWLHQIETSVYCNDSAIPRLRPNNRLLKDLLRNDWVPFQKILVSATFPTDDKVLHPFHLQNPRLIISESIFKSKKTLNAFDSSSLMTIPSNISIRFSACEDSDKPLLFLCFVLTMKVRRFLCFVNGPGTAQKLSSLLYFMMDKKSDVCFLEKSNTHEHAKLLTKFKNGELNGVISNDVLARGIDQEFETVLNYDSKLDAKTFVHRVGRCGRAGRKGTAYSLVSPYEVDDFLHMAKSLGIENPETKNFHSDEISDLQPKYVESLQQLKLKSFSQKTKGHQKTKSS